MYQPIFFSGPHGGGKSTLIEKLHAHSLFIENDFDIDFTTDFPNLNSLSSFERSLIRLYHRYFIGQYAYSLAKKYPDKFILTNRTVYDSEAYVYAYNKLGWITGQEYEKLKFVIDRFYLRPYAIASA